MVVGGVIAASFVQTVAFEQFTLALVVQLVLLEVGIIVRLATLAPLVLALLARGKFQVAQLLNVYVEVHRPLLLLAVVQGRLSRKRAAIVGVGNLYGGGSIGMIPPSLRVLAEEGLVEGLEVLAFLVLLGIDHKVSPFAGTVDEQRIVVLFELHNG